MAREILTIEGIGTVAQLHPMQEAFREHHGLQCGFCTPGMIMAGIDIARAAWRSPRRSHCTRRAGGQYLPLHRLPQHRHRHHRQRRVPWARPPRRARPAEAEQAHVRFNYHRLESLEAARWRWRGREARLLAGGQTLDPDRRSSGSPLQRPDRPRRGSRAAGRCARQRCAAHRRHGARPPRSPPQRS